MADARRSVKTRMGARFDLRCGVIRDIRIWTSLDSASRRRRHGEERWPVSRGRKGPPPAPPPLLLSPMNVARARDGLYV